MQQIDLRERGGKRIPMGLLLLALAAYCIWQGRDPDKLGLLIIGGCVGVIGLFMTGERRFLIIDESAGALIKRAGIFFSVPVATLPLAEIERVVLDERRVGGRKKRTVYRVSVAGPQRGKLVDYGDEWHARGVSERLAVVLRVPFENSVYGRRSVRDSNELDTPLAERWRAAGKIKERPALAADSRTTVDDGGERVRVHIPTNKGELLGGLVFLGVWIVFAAVFYFLIDDFSGYFFFYLFFGCSFAFIGMMLLAFSGRSRLTFTDAAISYRQGQAPMERSMELRSIEEMIITGEGLHLVGDSMVLVIGWPESSEDRVFLKAFVSYEIARRYAQGARA